MADIKLTQSDGKPVITIKIDGHRAEREARTIGRDLMKFLLDRGIAELGGRSAILKYIQNAGPNGVSRKDLAKRFGAKISKDQRQEILEDLGRAQLINWREGLNRKGPTALVFYALP